MRSSDLPAWLRGALPATRLGYEVVFDDADIARLLGDRRTIRMVDGREYYVRAQIPGRCWSCGDRYQYGVLTQPDYNEASTTRHIRRRGCPYVEYSSSWTGYGTWNPAVQTSVRLRVALRLTAER